MTPDDSTSSTPSTSKAAERAAAQQQAHEREPRFTVEELRERAGIMDEDGYTAAQVAIGLATEDDPDARYTRAEVSHKIKTALARPVEHSDAQQED